MQGDELRRVFAHNVSAWRQVRDITQSQLAAKAGIAQAFVAQIEAGVRFPRPEIMASLADALGTSPSSLLSTEGIFSETTP